MVVVSTTDAWQRVQVMPKRSHEAILFGWRTDVAAGVDLAEDRVVDTVPDDAGVVEGFEPTGARNDLCGSLSVRSVALLDQPVVWQRAQV